MSSFYAYDFMYDDIPSHRFDLKIISFEDGGLFSGVGSSDVNLFTQKVNRKSKIYYVGRAQEPVLQFPLTFGTARPISALDRDLISAWLFGKVTYKKLYILQDDLNGIYFNCFLTKPEPLYVGNMNYAFKCMVICDSPWGYGPEKTFSISPEYPWIDNIYFNIYNSSSEDDYLYPTVNFIYRHYIVGAMLKPPYIRCYNYTDSSRLFAFNYVISDEEITVYNDSKTITSSIVPEDGFYIPLSEEDYSPYTMPSDRFNNNWLRLLPGNNSFMLDMGSGIIYFEIKYTERFKIGG